MRVTIIGHSQVPDYLKSYEDVEVKSVRVRGGRIYDAYKRRMRAAIVECPDVICVWLGGNELVDQDVDKTIKELEELLRFIHNFVREVFWISVESRNHKPGDPRYHLNAKYHERAKKVNRALSRRARRSRQFRVINVASSKMAKDSRDGIHFSRKSKGWVVNKIKAAVRAVQRRTQ